MRAARVRFSVCMVAEMVAMASEADLEAMYHRITIEAGARFDARFNLEMRVRREREVNRTSKNGTQTDDAMPHHALDERIEQASGHKRADRFGGKLGRTKCKNCYSTGHWSNECPFPSEGGRKGDSKLAKGSALEDFSWDKSSGKGFKESKDNLDKSSG